MNLVVSLAYTLFFVASMFYILSKFVNKKYNFKDYKIYLFGLVITLFSVFNYYYVNSFVKVIILVLLFAISIKILLKESFMKSLISALYYEIIIVLSETIFALFINLAFGMNSVEIVTTQFGTFSANIIINIISLILATTKVANKIYIWICKAIDKINEIHIIIMCLISIIILNFLEATLYYDFDFRYLLIFNVLFIMFCFGIILYSFKTKNKYNKVYDKYNTTLNSLKEYEDILDKYRVSNHENKNQLLTIRNMISDKNKKAVKYIDEIVKNKLKDDEKIMQEVSVIPAGGLRGLIYSKILDMKEKSIEHELNISKEIRTVDLINKLDDSDMLDICQIIGVYIDNAIDALENLDDKYISIEMYLEKDKLVFEICNYYEGVIELDRLEQKGYTTKSNGHGYGLSLTTKIIENNKKLKNEKRLSKDTFTQVLKIKMK